MFENERISGRQLFRLLVFDLLGVGTILLPPILARGKSVGGSLAILLGLAAGWLYLLVFDFALKKEEKPSATSAVWPLILLVQALGILMVGGFLAYVFAKLICYSLLPDTSFALLLFLLVVLSAYAASGGIERRARIYELLFWPLLLPFAGMLLIAAGGVRMDYLLQGWPVQGRPMLERSLQGWRLKEVFIGAYTVFLLWTPLGFLIPISGKNLSKGTRLLQPAGGALVLSGSLLWIGFLILVGNFGSEALSRMQFPMITIMSTVQFEGNFLKRMDAFMIGIWFFALFAILSLYLHQGSTLLSEAVHTFQMRFSYGNGHRKGAADVGEEEKKAGTEAEAEQKKNRCPKRDRIILILSAFLVWLSAWGIAVSEGGAQRFCRLYALIGGPAFVFLPIFLLLRNMTKRRRACPRRWMCLALPFVLGIAQCSGCASVELEERAFALLVVCDYEPQTGEFTYEATYPKSTNFGGSTGEAQEPTLPAGRGSTFEEAKEDYEDRLSKQTDYNHLKVAVLGECLWTNERARAEFVAFLAKEEPFPRNTIVCRTGEAEELIKLGGILFQDPGTYLEEDLKAHKAAYVKVGDLIDEAANRLRILRPPLVSVKENYVVIE